jgi:hypothetical protein
MSSTVHLGLAVSSHADGTLCTSTISTVTATSFETRHDGLTTQTTNSQYVRLPSPPGNMPLWEGRRSRLDHGLADNPAATVQVDANANRRAIDPLIYGVNGPIKRR